MMGVSGKYVDKFNEASHVLFNGHLDDPYFRNIAIQKLVAIEDDSIISETSGKLRIKQGKKESVSLEYAGFFGKEKTTGFPFKDIGTPIVTATR
jgi:hypothetical protein